MVFEPTILSLVVNDLAKLLEDYRAHDLAIISKVIFMIWYRRLARILHWSAVSVSFRRLKYLKAESLALENFVLFCKNN